ncbi:MAG: efflux RND transporter periplasmic adaptor subunit, partial [Zoogloeaceae bacterium]|nr:efflux RND transporter periplasmic adaptor subunit [Zoogloeaceae bacterium]
MTDISRPKILLTLACVALLLLCGAFFKGGMWWAARQNPAAAPLKTQRAILYWYDPMKPEAHFDQPGKSPFMDMELQARYADEEDNAPPTPGFGLPPALTQNLGVKFAHVEKGVLTRPLEVSGSVIFDEHAIAVAQARAGGIVERAYPLAVGDVVQVGAALAEVRVPEWFAAQGEYLVLRSDPA